MTSPPKVVGEISVKVMVVVALSAVTRAATRACRQVSLASQVRPLELRRAWSRSQHALGELGAALERHLHAG